MNPSTNYFPTLPIITLPRQQSSSVTYDPSSNQCSLIPIPPRQPILIHPPSGIVTNASSPASYPRVIYPSLTHQTYSQCRNPLPIGLFQPSTPNRSNQLEYNHEYPMAHMNHISGPAVVSIPSYLPSSQQRPYQYDNGLHVPSSMSMPRPAPHNMQQSMHQEYYHHLLSNGEIKRPIPLKVQKRPLSYDEIPPPLTMTSSFDPYNRDIEYRGHGIQNPYGCNEHSFSEAHLEEESTQKKKKMKKSKGTDVPVLPYEEAAAYVQTLNIPNASAWKEYLRNNKLPPGIPDHPINAYRHLGWTGWSSWLGVPCEKKRRRLKVYCDFERGRQLAREFRLKSQREWWDLCVNGLRPSQVPGDPSRVYATSGWKGWRDWLGLDENYSESQNSINQ